jgi:hypothetical protein
MKSQAQYKEEPEKEICSTTSFCRKKKKAVANT